jgi:uncharacterized phiE125 gp8 family phage protein
MTPILIEGPSTEPVSLAEMRAHLRVEDEAEDGLIAGLTKAARLVVEGASQRILTASRWQILLDRWPRDRVIRLPLAPLLALERIRVFTGAGQSVDLPTTSYEADAASDPPVLVVSPTAPAPALPRAGIRIDLVAGFGPTGEAVPEPLRLAVKMLVARWFENRGDGPGEPVLPLEAMGLVAPFRRPRL